MSTEDIKKTTATDSSQQILLDKYGLSADKTTGTTSSSSTNNSVKTDEAFKVATEDFLKVFLQQLKYQDPTKPMEADKIADQLSSFTQTSYLKEINDKLGSSTGSGVGGAGSMAYMLNQYAVFDGSKVDIKTGKNMDLLTKLPEGLRTARLDVLNPETGKVVYTQSLDSVESGSQMISLKTDKLSTGNYELRLVGVGSNGTSFDEIPVNRIGTIEGFTLDEKPSLVINGEEVALSDLKEILTDSAIKPKTQL